MPKKKNEVKEMRITDYDKHGNIIPDITKIVVPYDVSVKVWERMNPGRIAKRKDNQDNDTTD